MKTCKLIIEDEVNIKLEGLEVDVRRKLANALKFEVPYAKYMPQYKLGRWDGKVAFFGIGGTGYVNHLDVVSDVLNKQGVEINELKELAEKQKNSINMLNEETSTQEETSKDELTLRFDEFINTCCIVRKDVEVDSCDIIAQFRIWNKVKPKRETNERFNTYLKTRFLATRLQNQTKDQCVHGFVGVILKSIEYKKTLTNDPTETFIFECCRFSPNNRIATNKLHEEYVRYKNKMGLNIISSELDDIKKYLNNCEYVQKGTLYIQEEKFTYEGYYGLALKTDNPNIRKISSNTGKKVQKIDSTTGSVLNNWTTIAKAATHENMSASKMSRSIKNMIMYGDSFYSGNEL